MLMSTRLASAHVVPRAALYTLKRWDVFSVISAAHHDNTRQGAPLHFRDERLLPMGSREGHAAVPRRDASHDKKYGHKHSCFLSSSMDSISDADSFSESTFVVESVDYGFDHVQEGA